MAFNDRFFLLQSEPARRIYAQMAEAPIYDFHCHLDPQEIYEDRVFENIVDLWLGGDHYKWRLMRANGVAEDLITGNAPKRAKFKAWIETVSRAYGNPLYHWSHLELRRIFGIETPIKAQEADALYDHLNKLLAERQLSPRQLIREAGVTFIGTTDNPLDDLSWHQKLSQEADFDTVVAPTFRPDQAFVDHPAFLSFLEGLETVTGQSVATYQDFVLALKQRVDYFAQIGCRASDISFAAIVYEAVTGADLDAILAKVRAGQALSDREVRQWQTGLFRSLCQLYKAAGFVTQVHFGALRNNHSGIYQALGADVGVDSMGDQVDLAVNLNRVLDDLVVADALPKMIWYNLNPSYNTVLANTLANFQANAAGIKGQLQFGAAWWFNDTKRGMLDQLQVCADQGMLANFVGMLTDSRSFLSYPRHDYFRRILANLIAQWVVDEEIPDDDEALGQLVRGIAYENARTFFQHDNV